MAEPMASARLTLALAASVLIHGALLASFALPRLKPGGSQPRATLDVILASPSPQAPAVSSPRLTLATAAAKSRPATKTPSHHQGGEMDSPPQPLNDIAPDYPEGAFALGLSGKVEVDVWVDERGQVEDARVVATTMADAFNNSALRAVHNMRFTPGMSAGRPVKSSIRAVIVYELQ